MRIAVNISVEQFRKGSITEIIKNCLEETHLQPQYLEIETTESFAMEETDFVVAELNELKKIGIGIAIDDFGTAYSSLSRLKELPVEKLKMAMQFVHGISLNSKDESIISLIIHLAKILGIKVVAEGVENETQLNYLSSEGCDQAQGLPLLQTNE